MGTSPGRRLLDHQHRVQPRPGINMTNPLTNSHTRQGVSAMKRRTFLGTALAMTAATPLRAALHAKRWDDAADVLERATAEKQVDAAVLHVAQGDESLTR